MNFYVDDCLRSATSVEEARSLETEVSTEEEDFISPSMSATKKVSWMRFRQKIETAKWCRKDSTSRKEQR